MLNLRPLKTGGQKEVFIADLEGHGQVVFKKILPGSNKSLDRTRREVRAVELLNDLDTIPEIISHNCNESDPEYLWIIEEYISGSNLRDILVSGRTFNINEIVDFLDTMLKISMIAEKNDLVHRDIKPENIMLDENNNFWLLDFGIARHLDLKSLTESNEPFGLFTVGYASSEQFRNLKKMIDIRADLFSIGVVCYEMILGYNYYIKDIDGDIFKVIKKLENNSLPPLSIDGDTQFLLSTFIGLLGNHRRNRRPNNAAEAMSIYNSLKPTLRL